MTGPVASFDLSMVRKQAMALLSKTMNSISYIYKAGFSDMMKPHKEYIDKNLAELVSALLCYFLTN